MLAVELLGRGSVLGLGWLRLVLGLERQLDNRYDASQSRLPLVLMLGLLVGAMMRAEVGCHLCQAWGTWERL